MNQNSPLMDLDNPVVKLCIEVTRAEFQGRLEEARSFSLRAWEIAKTDFEACIAAHYVARFEEDLVKKLHWNQVALTRASAARQDQVEGFYPSLYLNLAQSYELLNLHKEAQIYYAQAENLGVIHTNSWEETKDPSIPADS